MNSLVSRQYQTVITNRPEGPYLEVDIVSIQHLREHSLFLIKLCSLIPDELSMDAGRFQFFSQEKQNFQVDIPTKNFESVFEDHVNWIGQNVQHPWNFSVDIPHLGMDVDCFLNWSFERLDDARRFRLTF